MSEVEAPELNEQARKIVSKWKADIGQVVKYERMESDIATALSEARKQGRIEMREEATDAAEAKAAEYERLGDYGTKPGYVQRVVAANEIATEIRALKEQP